MKTQLRQSLVLLYGLCSCLAFSNLSADTYKYDPPVVKNITLSTGLNGKANTGDKVHVSCAIGYAGTMKIENSGTGPDGFLDASGKKLPYIIQADTLKIAEGQLPEIDLKKAPPPPLQADWTIPPAYAGKSIQLKCTIDPLHKVNNSIKFAVVNILGAKQPPLGVPGPAQTMKPISPLEKAIPKPDLAVTAVTTSLAASCADPQHLLSAKVSIRNNGMPLPAGKGYLHFSEMSGAHLTSGKMPLPAFNSGETKTVTLTGGTQVNFLNVLSWPHNIKLYFTPLPSYGQEAPFNQPNPPHIFSVSFSAGFCATQQGRSSAPSPSNNSRIQQQPAASPTIQRLMIPRDSTQRAR